LSYTFQEEDLSKKATKINGQIFQKCQSFGQAGQTVDELPTNVMQSEEAFT
jgi:hypothetical protein